MRGEALDDPDAFEDERQVGGGEVVGIGVAPVTPGVALAILQMRGREPTESSIEISARATADVVLQAGKAR